MVFPSHIAFTFELSLLSCFSEIYIWIFPADEMFGMRHLPDISWLLFSVKPVGISFGILCKIWQNPKDMDVQMDKSGDLA